MEKDEVQIILIMVPVDEDLIPLPVYEVPPASKQGKYSSFFIEL